MMRRAALFFVALAACAPRAEAPADCCTATITVSAPEGASTVYLAGSLPELGPWRPDGVAMAGKGRERTARVTAPAGTVFEYKLTLGNWDREALGPSGMVMANFRLVMEKDVAVRHEIVDFEKDVKDYIDDWRGSGVKGTLVYWTDVRSAFLGPARNVSIWLPPDYGADPERRYKTLYMSDGQNLFDPRIANTGVDWGVDEAVTALVEESAIEPVIVVGVYESADHNETPWRARPKDPLRFLYGKGS